MNGAAEPCPEPERARIGTHEVVQAVTERPVRRFTGRNGLMCLAAAVLSGLMLITGCEVLPEPAPPVPTLVLLPPATATPKPHKFDTVSRNTIEEMVTVRGRVVSVREALLYFEISGWIKELNVEPGERVVAGDLLAQLDAPQSRERELRDAVVDAEFDLKLKSLELQQAKIEPVGENIELAKANVKLAEIAVQQAQAKYDEIAWQGDVTGRAEAVALQKANVAYQAAQAEYLAKMAADEIDQQIQALRIQRLETLVEYAGVDLDRARTRLAEVQAQTQLEAPLTGLVVSLDKNVGDAVSPYESIGIIADPSELRVEASIPEEDMTYVTFGQPVRVILDAYPDTPVMGQVAGISTQPTIWQGRTAYDVVINFENPAEVPAVIRMGADIEIIARRVENTLTVPVEAVRKDGLQEYVEVIEDGEPVRITVRTGLSAGGLIEVIDGIAEGEQVLIP